MKRSEIILGLLRIPLDFGMTVAGLIAGYYLRLNSAFIPGIEFFGTAPTLLALHHYLEISFLFGGLLVLVFWFFGLYSFRQSPGPLRELRLVTKHSFVWMLLVMSYFFLTHQLFFSRLVLLYGFVFSLLFVLLERLLLRQVETFLLNRGIGRRAVLLIGGNPLTQHLASELKKNPRYTLKGALTKQGSSTEAYKEFKILGSLNDLEAVAKKYAIETLIITEQHLSERQDERLLEFCQEHHIEYRLVPDILAVERSNVNIEPLGSVPMIHLEPTPLDGWGRIAKRALDIVGSSLGLLLLSPLFAAIALLIRLDSQGSILFSRLEDGTPAQRIGQNGVPFTFYKFRTMTHNSHHLRSTLSELSHRKGPLLKIKNDPRITRVGRFLRRSSLDELPNLWSVLRGDMSLVGPRPHLPEEVSLYEGRHHFLLTVKPGITGLSQVSGRSDLDFEDEARLDSYYIKRWSLGMDLKILLKTVAVVFSGKAAD